MPERFPSFYSAVFVVLKNEKGEVLLQHRTNTGYMDGHYDASASGHVEPDESIFDAAIRESEEELGIRIETADLELILTSQMNADRPYLNYVFSCNKWEGEPQIMEQQKCDDLSWFSLNDLPRLLTPTLQLLKERKFTDVLSFEYVNSRRLKELMK